MKITAVRASWLSAPRRARHRGVSRGENPLLHELVEESFELRDGAVLAPERAGLGLTLRREFVRAITVA